MYNSFLYRKTQSGFSLVEVIVVSAIVALVFAGLFAAVQSMLSLVGHSKAEAGARSLAVSKLEYIRSLPYNDVGTVGGIPSGSIPQTSTTTLNGITYEERVFIQYLDRPEDGKGTEDENGINEDSKVVKVTYNWELRGSERSFTLMSEIIPKGIESSSGGGTLFIKVFDAEALPVSDASVNVFNDKGTSTIDVTANTNSDGEVYFPGTPARSGYQITATKDGFSTDQTYSTTATNTSPNPQHISVIESEISSASFSIDELSTINLSAFETPVTGSLSDDFADTSKIASSSSVSVASSNLDLSGSSDSYSTSGFIYSNSISPSDIDNWKSLDFVSSTTSTTDLRLSLYSVSGSGTSTNYQVVPDSDLSGNEAGFIEGEIDLSGLNVSAYPRLAVRVELSGDGSETPSLDSFELSYVISKPPVSDLTVNLNGSKTIGEYEEEPVLKNQYQATTDSNGEAVINDVEWDSYEITIDEAGEGYVIREVRPSAPLNIEAGTDTNLDLVMGPYSANTMRLTVTDSGGNAIEGATVSLTRSGESYEATTSAYGQVFFPDLTETSDYTIEVSKTGYTTYSESNVSVSGNENYIVEINQ